MKSVRDQIEDLEPGTRVYITGRYLGAEQHRAHTLIEKDRNGHAVFEPSGLREDRFAPLDDEGYVIEEADVGPKQNSSKGRGTTA